MHSIVTHGDGIRKPLEQITTVEDMRQALLHLEGMALEEAASDIDNSIRNHSYVRGDMPHLLRNAPRNVRGKLEQYSNNTILHKDVIKPKVQQFTALLSRAAPEAQIKALRPDAMGEFAYEDMFYQNDYENRVVATKLNDAVKLERQMRKEQVLKKRQVEMSLIDGMAFTVYSVRQDMWRGTVVNPRLAYRHQVLLDPAAKDISTFWDSRYIRVQTEMSAAEIYARYGLAERDYMGGDSEKNYLDDASMIRRYWTTSDAADDQVEVKREMPAYPVKAFFWNPGVPDLLNFDGDVEEMRENPQRKDTRARLFILVNDWAIPYGMKEEDKGPDLMGLYPIVCHCHDPMSDRAGGYSLVDTIIGTQDFIDICYNAIGKNVRANAYTQWMAERGAVQGKNFSMKSNILMYVEHDAISRNRIKQIEPGDVGSSVHNLMQNEVAYTRELSGDPQGILSGIAPSSVKSGIHAQTLLETANTLMAEYARMLDVGHLNAANLETMMMQKHTDFANEFYSERLGLDEYPNIDLAMADLKFDVQIDSKAMLPSTTVSGEWNIYMIMYNMGLIPPATFMKLTEMSDKMPEEWMAQMEAMTKTLVPGIPIAEQVQQMLQARELMAQMDAEIQQAGGGGLGMLQQMTEGMSQNQQASEGNALPTPVG